MYPILFTIGKVSIPTYTVLLDLGLILGLVLTYIEGKRILGSAETALDLGLWTVIGGILGGRIGFVVAQWGAFSEDWGQVFQIWKGGLSFHGAFLGGVGVELFFSLVQRRREHPASFWQLADALTPGLALGLVFGWAACLMGGCAYGVVGEGFGYLPMPDLFGAEASRFATQIVGLALAAVLFIAVWLLRGRWPFSGAAFLMFNLLYFGSQYFLESTRGDESIYLGPLRLAQVLDLALAMLAAVGLFVLWWRARQGVEESEAEEGTEEPATPEEPGEAAVSGEPGLTGDDEVVEVADAPEEAGETAVPEEPKGTQQ